MRLKIALKKMKQLLHFFLFSITICVSITIPAVHSHCIEDQRLSLLHLKESLEFDSYDSYDSSKLMTWNSSTDCCSWLGVTCNTKGHVVKLDLSGEFITSGIDNSSSLFRLQHLESLNLAKNYLLGSPIPSEIGKLTNLRYLNLSDVSISKEVPIAISSLTRLAVLDLSISFIGRMTLVRLIGDQNINLSMLVQNLTELTELHLNGVYLGVQAPHWCQAISSSLLNLRVLSLSDCELSGPICESLTNLQSLSEIYLDQNKFYSPIPRLFANFSKLTSMNLKDCNLHGTFPKEIFQIPCLQTIDLSSNRELGGSFPEFPKNGSLQSMNLRGTKFSGILPNSIGNLKKLSSISLSGCSFTGSVPKSIENLTKLVHLDMSWNMFNGPISAIHWESLVNLESLRLRNNLLNGSIPSSIFSLPSLRGELVLSNNQFSGQVPEFSNTTSYRLGTLDLRNNSLEGQIPTSIFNFQELQYLNLSSNKFSGFPIKGPQQPTTLSNIDLSHNQIQGQIPNWIWRLNSLQELNLSCNSLETLEAPLLNSTFNVLVLDLHSNQLQGQIPRFVSGRYLDYSRNNFSSSIPTDIGDFISNMTYLSLSSNNLHGAIPKSICIASLMVLDLSNNSLSDIIPQCLTQLQSLSVLDLRRNNLTGIIPDNFLEDCKLQTLNLNRNQMQGKFPNSLINCSSLEVLNLGNNQITDNFPCSLASISTLRVLVLRFNKFYGSIGCLKTIDNWPTWPRLQIIDLAHNNLSGEIPVRMSRRWQKIVANEDDFSTEIVANEDDFSTEIMANEDASLTILGFTSLLKRSPYNRDIDRDALCIIHYTDSITAIIKGLELDLVKIPTIFTLIDFSSNNFNGSIPEEMGQLTLLHDLNLSGNALTGEIPSSFGNMRQLESLDLSQNHLSGQIPPQFANLTFLSFLNVSNNQLTGRIPTSTQLSTLPITSFEGNQGLWGPPLTTDTAKLQPPMSNGSSSNLNSGDEIDWEIIIVEIGFTCGFGIVVGSLLFCKRWRKWYYKAMCNILFKIFPQLEQIFGEHGRNVFMNTRWRH